MYATGGLCVYVGCKNVCCYSFLVSCISFACRSSTILLSLSSIWIVFIFEFWMIFVLCRAVLCVHVCFFLLHFVFFYSCFIFLQICDTRIIHSISIWFLNTYYNYLYILYHTIAVFFFLGPSLHGIITVIINFTFCLRWAFASIVWCTNVAIFISFWLGLASHAFTFVTTDSILRNYFWLKCYFTCKKNKRWTVLIWIGADNFF